MIELPAERWLYYHEPNSHSASHENENEEDSEESLYQECSMKELLDRLAHSCLQASLAKVSESTPEANREADCESNSEANREAEVTSPVDSPAHSITFESWVKPKGALYWKKLRFQPQLLLELQWDLLPTEESRQKASQNSSSPLSIRELLQLFEQGKLAPLSPIKPSITNDWGLFTYSQLHEAVKKQEESLVSAVEACPPPLYQKIQWNDMGFTVLAIFILVNFIALTGSPLVTQLSCLIVLLGLLIPSLQALAINQLGGTPAMHLAHLSLLTSNGKRLTFLTALQRQSLNLYSVARLKSLPLELESEGASLWDKERSIVFRHEP